MTGDGADGGHLRIRDATALDASSLAAFAAALFRDTYATSAAPADLESYIAQHFTAAAQTAEIAATDWRTLVAEVDGELVGYAQLWHGPAPACVHGGAGHPGPALEIKRFYVARRWQGRGIAPQLMATCLHTPARGTPIWLGVFAHNSRAIAFYSKCGFRVVGETTFLMGQDPQRDYIMLAPSALESRGSES